MVIRFQSGGRGPLAPLPPPERCANTHLAAVRSVLVAPPRPRDPGRQSTTSLAPSRSSPLLPLICVLCGCARFGLRIWPTIALILVSLRREDMIPLPCLVEGRSVVRPKGQERCDKIGKYNDREVFLYARMGCTGAPVLLFRSRPSWKFNTIPDMGRKLRTELTYWSYSPNNIQEGTRGLEKEIEPAGLFVDPDLPCLAATSDGLVGNDALVGVKRPVTARNLTPQEEVEEKKLTYCILKDDHLYLKENHPYMYQRWNARAGETGEPRENSLASGIVRHDSHNVKIRERPRQGLNQTRTFAESSDHQLLFSHLSFSSAVRASVG
ncbi:hypothetical protein PR048_018250 [Dryococelus australis]|uniref:Uncharacterized protein n=1 Tax=Dryococelus australis TaxID=614101 RepID=A0ABQ9HBW9_9NEOP|nr:hypothetical protein PR048_018250 [Dryococelus australis]